MAHLQLTIVKACADLPLIIMLSTTNQVNNGLEANQKKLH